MNRRILISAIIIAAALLVFSSCSMDMRGKGTVHILSVALDYNNESLSPLNGTINDAVEIGECLSRIYESKGIPVEKRYMLQRGTDISESDPLYPSAWNVFSAINSTEVSKEDLFVFFYSGHGDAGVNDDGSYDGTGYLAGAKGGDDLYTPINMDSLFHTIDAMGCPAVIIIDACYSGNTADNESAVTGWDGLLDGLNLLQTSVLTASQPTELSYVSSTYTEEGDMERHSLFTIAILQALGWRHSSFRGSYIYAGGQAIWANGYLAYTPQTMTTEDLEEIVMGAWSNSQQTPYFNSTGMKIKIVP